MLMERGHNEKLDCWTLGILLYEILVGRGPFAPPKVEGKSQPEIYEMLKRVILVSLDLLRKESSYILIISRKRLLICSSSYYRRNQETEFLSMML
jgi:hypothetical protein